MIFHQLYCRKCFLPFITKTAKEPCPICGWIMLADYHKNNLFNKENKMNNYVQGKLKIYIAASYPRILEAKALGQALEKLGHEILSYWHIEGNSPVDSDYTSGQRAIRDHFALQQCNLFVEFIGDNLSKGGRHAELGLALAWNKKIILIGESDNCILANLPWLAKVKTVEELIKKITQ